MPFELLSQIVRYLLKDSAAVKAFSQTCHSWNAAGKPALFHAVTLDSVERLEELCSLTDNNPAIATWIHEIHLNCDALYGEAEDASPALIFAFVDILQGKLENLQTLALNNLSSFRGYASRDFFNKLSQFSTVTSLTFRRCTLPVDVWNPLISSFPHLSDLHVHSLSFNHSSEGIWVELQNFPRCSRIPPITSFRCHSVNRDMHMRLFGRWFQESMHSPTLRTVSIYIFHHWELEELGQFLRWLGDSLENLEILFLTMKGQALSYSAIKRCMKLSTCTQIRTLRLHDPGHRSVHFFLLCVPAANLRRMDFTLTFYRPELLKSTVDCAQLDAMLTGKTYRGLETVCFTYVGPLSRDMVEREVRSRFPKLSKRVVIQVEMQKREPLRSTEVRRRFVN
ncbi:uncharacterized protein LAESUDRAFT_727847 [Laetiporus sulphureus 93-53]|uniref:F-box domain-containing protein n=1 Tax=Laetiporus sulphureus 93-53 TaxID=1314785 RepID=A0A165DDZ1_9APHY|nr:uncharacterized protein LAESUDRAFT_727847 [Laetiporus sulphureus 93-53]KZT04669.1 hypothetical protein LAESUDRAFT_727847 [Laetiporus sulphureus 93-53]